MVADNYTTGFAQIKSSKKKKDIERERLVGRYMDSIYKTMPEIYRFERETNFATQQLGVDVGVKLNNRVFSGMSDIILLDEKCATDYWNKDLKTFVMEVYCPRNYNSYGWLNNPNYVNNYYNFIWIRSDDAELTTNVVIDFAIISKEVIKKLIGLTSDDIDRLVAEVKDSPDCKHYVGLHKVVYSKNLPETPINILLTKREIMENALIKRVGVRVSMT